LKLCFSLMSRTIIYFHVYIIFLDIIITYKNASVLCQSECACLHKTFNMVVFFVKGNENTYLKGRALMQMHRVVPMKRGNYGITCVCISCQTRSSLSPDPVTSLLSSLNNIMSYTCGYNTQQ